MSANLGQLVIVENKAGVGGVLGVDTLAKAPPDGYTLASASGSPVAIAPFSMYKMPYDPKKDLRSLCPFYETVALDTASSSYGHQRCALHVH